MKLLGRRLSLTTLAIGLLGPLAVAGCHRTSAPVAEEPAAVMAETVHSGSLGPVARRGVMIPGSRIRLGFNTIGIVGRIDVKAGDTVRKGAVLARLQSGAATASLRAAEAHRVRAARDHDAAAKLAETGAVAATKQEDARSALDVASANTVLAATLLADRRILSPINGSVLERRADPGEVVGPGAPVLVVDDTEHLVVRVGVTEAELGRIRAGGGATLFASGGQASVPAVVKSVGAAPLSDGLYAVEVEPRSHATHSLRAGTPVSVQFEDMTPATVMRAPLDAVVYRQGKTWVFVLEDVAGVTRARIREVSLARAEGAEVVIQSGLAEGERIVREGAYFLEDNEPVKVVAGSRERA